MAEQWSSDETADKVNSTGPRATRPDLAGAVDLGCSLIYSGESLPLKVQ